MTVRKTANPLPAWLTLAVPIVSVVISICATFLSYKTYTSNKLLYRPYAIATPYFDDTGKNTEFTYPTPAWAQRSLKT
jgi:hypothetical protein